MWTIFVGKRWGVLGCDETTRSRGRPPRRRALVARCPQCTQKLHTFITYIREYFTCLSVASASLNFDCPRKLLKHYPRRRTLFFNISSKSTIQYSKINISSILRLNTDLELTFCVIDKISYQCLETR